MDRNFVLEFLREEEDIRELVIANNLIDEILVIGNIIAHGMSLGKKIAFCGNGGSATLASHMTGEFVGRYKRGDLELPAISFNDTANLTAISNDYGYDQVFVKQIKAHLRSDDILVVFSTSGNSQNLINAVEYANKVGIKTIALAGKSGGKLLGLANYCLCVPSTNTPVIQSMHLTIGHLFCEFVDAFFEEEEK